MPRVKRDGKGVRVAFNLPMVLCSRRLFPRRSRGGRASYAQTRPGRVDCNRRDPSPEPISFLLYRISFHSRGSHHPNPFKSFLYAQLASPSGSNFALAKQTRHSWRPCTKTFSTLCPANSRRSKSRKSTGFLSRRRQKCGPQ